VILSASSAQSQLEIEMFMGHDLASKSIAVHVIAILLLADQKAEPGERW
jgi:hypothetical protein